MSLHLITVIPIARAVSIDTLSYFASTKFPTGSIVLIPLRGKEIPALVTEVNYVTNEKAYIKSQGYALKKITAKRSYRLVSEELINSAKRTATYFATTVGAVLHVLIPRAIERRYASFEIPQPKAKKENRVEKRILQLEDTERFSQYRSIIREAFAHKTSVFFCIPSAHALDASIDLLQKGIEDYTFIIHAGLSPQKLKKVWQGIQNKKHPVLIIGTAPFLSLSRNDIHTIIIEREGSRAYKILRRPFIDFRIFVEYMAEALGAQLIFGDSFLRLSTLERYSESIIGEAATPTFRALSPVTTGIVSLKEKNEKKVGFHIVSNDLEELITYATQRKENLFIYTARRGLAPLTVCGDCGASLLCHRCEAPLVLHKTRMEENRFICHHCAHEESSVRVCDTCGSWKLITLGIGIELAEQVLKEDFPNVPIFRIDSDTVTTYAQGEKIESAWRAHKGAILLGTEKALTHLRETNHSAILSIDTLFATPDFSINERIFRTISFIKSKTKTSMLVQTREPNAHVLDHALKGNILAFYKEERKLRKRFFYPPFAVLIRIAIEGQEAHVKKQIITLSEKLAPYDPVIFPTPIRISKTHIRTYTLLKIPSHEWPKKELISTLELLPPSHTIHIEPDNLFS